MLCNLTSYIRDNINDLFYEKFLNTRATIAEI